MRTLADFRRAAQPGSRWHVDNHLHPNVTGIRVITRATGKAMRYDYTRADGTTGQNGWTDFPKRNECRIEGDSVHFLYEPGSDRVAFTWTLLADQQQEVQP